MKQNRLIIGLTGGSGSGKSIVAKAAVDLGFVHIDTDKLGHNVILKPYKTYYDLIKVFGNEILNDEGEIDRKKLGQIAFSTPENLKLLSEITHPAIVKKTKELIGKYTIIDGAVIYQTKEITDMCDSIITVTNSDERRISLICSRDNISVEVAKNRINNQMNNDFYSSYADIVITNDGSAEELYNKSIDVLKRCISEKNI